MRAVIQRVRSATVRVNHEVVGEIGPGLLVYVAVGSGDCAADIRYLAGKIVNLRIFPDGDRPMNRSVMDEGGQLLIVSQFTLYGDCRKGRRPSFNEAMAPQEAESLIDDLIGIIEAEGVPVSLGQFGAMMDVESVNWGPVTVLIDSNKTF